MGLDRRCRDDVDAPHRASAAIESFLFYYGRPRRQPITPGIQLGSYEIPAREGRLNPHESVIASTQPGKACRGGRPWPPAGKRSVQDTLPATLPLTRGRPGPAAPTRTPEGDSNGEMIVFILLA